MSTDTLNIRDCRNGNWYFVDNKLIKEFGKFLGFQGVAVYNVLAMYANNETQSANPSFKTVGDQIDMSRRHVMRMIDKLEQCNIIHREPVTVKNKNTGKEFSRPSIITLLSPDEWCLPVQSTEVSDYTQPSDSESLVTDSHQGGDSESQGVVTDSHTNNTNNNKTKRTRLKDSPAKLSNHPAIQAYRTAWQRYPAKNCMQDIIDAVGDDPAEVKFYEQVCRHYKLLGWSPKNHDNMFYYLRKHELPETNKNGANDGRQRQGNATQGKRGTTPKAERARDQKRKTRADQQVNIINL